MRVLWICNMIIPEYSEIYGVRKRVTEGWISGMFSQLVGRDDTEIACCFPIIDEEYMKQSKKSGLLCYSFHAAMDKRLPIESDYEEFIKIYTDFKPDVIHIWGTEYHHSEIAVKAAEKKHIKDRVIIHIQGLVSAIVPYYCVGVSSTWLDYKCNGKLSIREEQQSFSKRGVYEIEAIKSTRYILGRTSWDKAYVYDIAPKVNYLKCGEILRDSFYNSRNRWSNLKCQKHSIVLSQALYSVKGFHLILPSIKKLYEEYEDLRVFVCGDSGIAGKNHDNETPYDRLLLELMDELGIKDIVTFTGAKSPEDMVNQYLESHVFVSSSTIENSSNSIGEAQLLGVPVVATYTGGTPDLVEHEKTGLLYQMDAGYMFAACIRRIFDDDDFAMKLSKEEQRVAAKRYDPGRVKKELLAIYEEVAGERVLDR